MAFFAQKPTGLDELLNRPRSSPWQRFFEQPCVFLSRVLYIWRTPIPAQPLTNAVSVVCISDTHNSQPPVPNGDMLIHAGDLTQSGSLKELQTTIAWLHTLPHPIKIVVAGNHDLLLDASREDPTGHAAVERESLDWGDIIYLQNASTILTCANGRRLRIYGNPNSPRHGDWAFQYPRNLQTWDIPSEVDILVTHCPPQTHLDTPGSVGAPLGCAHLLREVWRVQPRLHVFGHVHGGAGTEWLQFDGLQSAYERAAVNGGVMNLVRTAVEFVRWMLRPAVEPMCLLVNAAMVGGLRDGERRPAVRVVI